MRPPSSGANGAVDGRVRDSDGGRRGARSSDLFVGLDAGTSEVKASLFDARFAELATARARVPVSRPAPGRSEVLPADLLDAVFDVLARVADGVRHRPGAIAGLGVTGAMVGAWTVDADGEPTGPGILWEDSRSEAMLAEWRRGDPDFDRRVFASSGCALQQGCTLPLFAWLLRHEPERMARTAHVIGLKDIVRHRLTGAIATDAGEATVAPGSAASRGRSEEMLALFGLADDAWRLPEPRPGEALAGHVTPAAAERSGLPPGLPVAVGTGDVPASVIGAGGAGENALTVILGTTCMVGRELAHPTFEPAGLGLLFTLPGDRWFRAMVNVAGTLNLDWALATLAPDLGDDLGAFEALAREAPAGADGASWLPYLSESGIIAPVVDADARAGFAGLTPRTTRACLARAVYEGVAFAIADCADALAFGTDAPVRLIGGGARSDFWAQLIADVLGRPLERPAGEQFGARGAAVLGAIAAGRFVDVRDALSRAPADGRTTLPSALDYGAARARWTRYRDRTLAHVPHAATRSPDDARASLGDSR